MKKIFLLLSIFALSTTAGAQSIIRQELPVSDIEIKNSDKDFSLKLNLNASKFKPASENEYWITPVIVSAAGTDSVEFEPILLAGRSRYYRHLRDNDLDGTEMYRSGKNTSIAYTGSVAHEPWMNNATVRINTLQCGCCSSVLGNYSDPIARIKRVEYNPVFAYIHPVAETVKEFKLEGTAYVNFPVNRTELYPEYMSNPAELAKITNTLDSVKSDSDITITSVFIKGFASPEGSYKNNIRLAKGRTETLREYVVNYMARRHNFDGSLIRTDYLPEDWPGLRRYVENSAIENRSEILALIDSPMEPDAKNDKIKQLYPKQYSFLLAAVYPSLRHSDYIINYNVKSYTSLEEILRVLKTAPQKLSLEEFYRAAQSMKTGSDEFNEVFETAVHIFPEDAVANLNAASSAMQRGDFNRAERYLAKAGSSPEAVYARGVCAALQKNYDTAESYFKQAADSGYASAKQALDEIQEVRHYADGKVEIIK